MENQPRTSEKESNTSLFLLGDRPEPSRATVPKLPREARRTAELMESLPAGVAIWREKDGRAKQWVVRYGRDRKKEGFESERDRNDRAVSLAKILAEEGRLMLNVDPAKWRQLLAFEARTGITLAEAEEIVLRVRGNLRLNLTFTEAAAKYMEMRIAEGLPKLSQIHPKLHLKRFGESVGHFPLVAITTQHVRDWLAGLKVSAVTRRHHRKNLNVFFERAKLEKWCLENPCAAVLPPSIVSKDTTVLKADEVFRLLKVNRDFPVAGRIAFELFGGLRCSSVERLKPEHVRDVVHGIEMPAAQHKSRKRKFRQGQPAVLWAWAKHAAPGCWEEITEKNYDEKKREAFIRAGVPMPHNVLRHSFASYMIASTKNLPLVSYLMQHSGTRMTERYEGVADENDARLVLAMTPDAVAGTWEDYLAAQSRKHEREQK